MQISFTVFHPNESINVESKNIKICVLLGFYAAFNCNFHRCLGTTYWSHLYGSRAKLGSILYPEISVRNYHSTLHKFQKSADLIHTSAEAWNYDMISHKPLYKAGLRLLLSPISWNSLSHFTWTHSIVNFIQMWRRKSKAWTECCWCNFSVHGIHWTLFLGTPCCSMAVDGYLSYWIAAKSMKKYVLYIAGRNSFIHWNKALLSLRRILVGQSSSTTSWRTHFTDYFNTIYLASFIILYCDQQMYSYFTNFHTPTCFDTRVSNAAAFEVLV